MVTTREQAVWGIHGGRTGDADSIFLKHHVIALGWDKMGDLYYEQFDSRYKELLPLKQVYVPEPLEEGEK